MSNVSQLNVASLAPPTLPPAMQAKAGQAIKSLRGVQPGSDTQKLREAFTQFVGETFYGQMIKAMRSTVGKPAYFHGGRAEEAFQGQLDQAMSEHLTKTTADQFAEPLFRRQFPHLARAAGDAGLKGLGQLSRR